MDSLVQVKAETSATSSITYQGRSSFINGSFEEPHITSISESSPNTIPGWKTTDTVFEVWRPQDNIPYKGAVAPADGAQYVELNAKKIGMLYQDVVTTPGQTIYWRLAHRGRYGKDTMRVRMGAVRQTPSETDEIEEITDGNQAWGYHHGSYTVPDGQTITRFGFESVSATGGIKSVGNFLDSIYVGIGPDVIATQSVNPEGQVQIGNELTYKVTVKNAGGDIAANSIFTDEIPVGTEFVPGSIQVKKNSQITNITDEQDTDSGYYQDGKVTVDLGDVENIDSLSKGITVQFKVRVVPHENKKIENKADISYKDLLKEQDELAQTNTVVNEKVAAAAPVISLDQGDQECARDNLHLSGKWHDDDSKYVDLYYQVDEGEPKNFSGNLENPTPGTEYDWEANISNKEISSGNHNIKVYAVDSEGVRSNITEIKLRCSKSTVTAKFINEQGDELIPSIVMYEEIGTPYKFEPENISGYKLKTTEGNIKGIITQEPQTIVFIYENGNLEFISAPGSVSFGTDLKISSEDKTYPLQSKEGTLTVQDYRDVGHAWSMTAKLLVDMTSENGHMLQAGLHYHHKGEDYVLQKNISIPVYETVSTGNEMVTISDLWDAKQEGLILKVKAGQAYAEEYKGTIQWTLQDVPGND
ncbi:MucBP domain-containing protein [Bacillus cereus]|nr:MucBP domain-containing protein [Bacillus cereus]